MNQPAKVWDVISPDGFSIHYSDTYADETAAVAAFMKWKQRYQQQGYYSSCKGRIPLEYLKDHCTFIEIDNPDLEP